MSNKEYEYFQKIVSIQYADKLSDIEIYFLFNELLVVLSNNGKLYKYKQIDGKPFDNIFETLCGGYIYLPSSSLLNDKIDTTLL